MNNEVIQIQGFQKRFGSKVVHKDVSFSVYQGECLGLIGGSGSGKSVLLRSLIGLENPDAGQMQFHGRPLQAMTEDDWLPIRKKIAYVFQGGALFDSMTVFENLAYPLRAHTQLSEKEIAVRITRLLTEFGLQGNEALLPASLSGGMQKRVGLARSIIMEPEIILYDEPTAGLDPYNTNKIETMILQLKAKGATSVLVTHDMPVAFSVCDRIAFLRDGVIAEIQDMRQGQIKEGLLAQFAKGELK